MTELGAAKRPAKKVLVVDDDEGIARIIHDFLSEKGYAVTVAYNGERALREAEQSQPDVVILDVELPDMTGFDVCQKIRQMPSLRNTPIIMLTVRAAEDDEVAGFHSGADDYMTKPFKPARLLARLQTAIERNVRELDANPLTHLPGNSSILQDLERRLERREPFAVLYIDLNNFKAFNDRYGFLRGDQVIRHTGELLSSCVDSRERRDRFLGHVGGDDFVAIIDPSDADSMAQLILERFDASIFQFYDEEDRKRGHIETVDRRGREVQFPLMGIAIAIVSNLNRSFAHPGEVSLVAGELKKLAKSKGTSAYVFDRRR
jgi:diguanylate cyclase (GGDEF)-like protein